MGSFQSTPYEYLRICLKTAYLPRILRLSGFQLVCLLWGFADFSAKLNSLDFQQIRAMIIPVAAASSLCSCLLFIRCQSFSCVQVQNQVTLHSLQYLGWACAIRLAHCVNNSNTFSPPVFIRFIFHILFR